MATAVPLTLNGVIQLSVYLTPPAAPRNTFNKGLVVGSTVRISISERVRVYTSAAGMIIDGFGPTDPEYLAAVKYFSQVPTPTYLYVGRQDKVASKIDTVSVAAAGGAGSDDYHVGDILTVVQSGASGGTLRVATLDGSGGVATVTVNTPGTGYSDAVGLATTVSPSGGLGCTITITAVRAETTAEALAACRAASSAWYAAYVIGAAKADHILNAAWCEAATPYSTYLYDTADSDARAGTSGNIFDTLKGLSYTRSMGVYSTTTYAGAALLGRAMGLNTGLSNSAYIMDFKNLVGVTAENLVLTGAGPLTENDVTNIKADNGNVYIQRGSFYNWFEDGRMANGRWFDQVINADMLVEAIQLNVSDLFNSVPKVPFTDQGGTQIMAAVARACDQAVTRGYLAPGTWQAQQAVLALQPGAPMPKGYIVQSIKEKDIALEDRSARIWRAIYVACHEAGGVQSILIGVYLD